MGSCHKSTLKPSFPLLCSCILLVHSRTPALQLAFYVTFFVRIDSHEKIDQLFSHSPRQELQKNIKQFQHKWVDSMNFLEFPSKNFQLDFWSPTIPFPSKFRSNLSEATKTPRPTDKLFLFHKNLRETRTLISEVCFNFVDWAKVASSDSYFWELREIKIGGKSGHSI